jgi:hypothetical protein
MRSASHLRRDDIATDQYRISNGIRASYGDVIPFESPKSVDAGRRAGGEETRWLEPREDEMKR